MDYLKPVSIHLGDLPTWVAAVATAGTLAVSLGLLSREMKELRHRDQEKRASQSADVAGWVVGRPTRAGSDPYPQLRVRIRNGSNLPIFEISLKVEGGVHGTFVRNFEAMGPHETREFHILFPTHPRGQVFAPAVMFTDAAGMRWLRDSMGKLQECEMTEPYFREDPGQYISVENHPTLHLPEDEFLYSGGRIVQ